MLQQVGERGLIPLGLPVAFQRSHLWDPWVMLSDLGAGVESILTDLTQGIHLEISVTPAPYS